MSFTEKFSFEHFNKIFTPQSVAVLGASNNSNKLGFHVMKSLTQSGYQGKIYPINPGSEQIMGLKAYASLSDIESSVDLAIIVLPAHLVMNIFQECKEKGIQGIVLITAGFKEIEDPNGAKQQEQLTELANEANLPVIGPNTFGLLNLHTDLNASFTPEFSKLEKGNVALVSQSGGISHLLGFMAMNLQVKMSKIVGLGNRLNVDFADMLIYLAQDPESQVIVLYLEGIDNPRELIQATENIRGKKPVLAYKAGRAKTSNQASVSHTGSMAGKQEIYEAAFRQSGIYCLSDSERLLDMAQALTVCSLPQGPKIAVLSAQAGPSMIACDICHDFGLDITTFKPTTQETINELLPPLALRTNPVDMGPAWYNSSALQGIVRAVMEDENVDGIILLTMFASANVETVPNLAELFLEWDQKKPLITCLSYPSVIWDDTLQKLTEAKAIYNLPSPERAARVMADLYHYTLLVRK